MPLAVAPPLFVGPISFLVGALLVVVLVFLLARVVFGVVARVILIAAVVLGLLWLFGALGAGPPGLG